MSSSLGEAKEINHWTPEEEINYNIFLIFKINELLTLKSKPPGFYVEMSRFIPSRSKVQCRSHHEKMIGRFKDHLQAEKKDLELLNVKAFFRDHIALRLLDSKHLLKEIDHHLQKKHHSGILTKEFCCLFREKAQANLQMLDLDQEYKERQTQPDKPPSTVPPKEDITNDKTYSEPQEYHLSYLFQPIEEHLLFRRRLVQFLSKQKNRLSTTRPNHDFTKLQVSNRLGMRYDQGGGGYIFLNQMKKLQNPTTFFFKQAENPPDLYRKQIDEFVNKLLDKDNCPLCKKGYDTIDHIPRIMIHCGHTFCTPCLKKFYMNRRVRCPMCLKLVKQLDNIDRLPINHTIFAHIVKKESEQAESNGKSHPIKNASVFLFGEFERVQKEAHMRENPQRIDQQSGLPFCVFHNDRVEHFYCDTHKASGCRVCIQIGHPKNQCQVIDLYNVPDPQRYLNPLEARIEDADISEPMVDYYNHRPGMPNNMFNLNNNDDDDQDLVDDSDQDDAGRKSV